MRRRAPLGRPRARSAGRGGGRAPAGAPRRWGFGRRVTDRVEFCERHQRFPGTRKGTFQNCRLSPGKSKFQHATGQRPRPRRRARRVRGAETLVGQECGRSPAQPSLSSFSSLLFPSSFALPFFLSTYSLFRHSLHYLFSPLSSSPPHPEFSNFSIKPPPNSTSRLVKGASKLPPRDQIGFLFPIKLPMDFAFLDG